MGTDITDYPEEYVEELFTDKMVLIGDWLKDYWQFQAPDWKIVRWFRRLSGVNIGHFNVGRLLKNVLAFLSYSTPLVLVCEFIYLTCGVFVNAIVIGTLFYIASLFI